MYMWRRLDCTPHDTPGKTIATFSTSRDYIIACCKTTRVCKNPFMHCQPKYIRVPANMYTVEIDVLVRLQS